MAGRYAAEMAKRGVIALAFDFRTWGASEGPSRSLENPSNKIADILAAATYLQSRAEISSIHGLGICASAGYMAHAARGDTPLSSIALVAPWLHNQAIVNAVYGGSESVAKLIATGQQAAAQESASGQPQLITAAGKPGSGALMELEGYYVDPQRGMIPAWENTFNIASWQGWLTFDAITTAAHIHIPTVIIHSEATAIPQGAKLFLDQLQAPKQQHWLPEVTQFDFYDQDQAVTTAADYAAHHLAQVLTVKVDQSQSKELAHGAIIKGMEQVAALADSGDFQALEQLFADWVAVDYFSLTAQPVEVIPATALMTRWASLLPGFDRTQHSLSDLSVTLNDTTAQARATVQADHWLDDKQWTVKGHYAYTFVATTAGWKISNMTFNLSEESGDHAIIAQALAKAKQSPASYLQE